MKIFPPRLQIFKSHEAQNLAVFTTENIPFLQLFITQSLTIPQVSLPLGRAGWGPPVRPSLYCNGASIALQRRPRCNMTACSLQPRGGPGARRNPLFDLKITINKPPTFAKFESRGALKRFFEAAGLSPLGERDGAVVGFKALIGHENANL